MTRVFRYKLPFFLTIILQFILLIVALVMRAFGCETFIILFVINSILVVRIFLNFVFGNYGKNLPVIMGFIDAIVLVCFIYGAGVLFA